MLWRLLAPKPVKKARRTVRKAAHPVHTAARAATPKSVKKLQRAAHPVELAQLKAEDAAVYAVKGRRGSKRASPKPAGSAAPPAPWVPQPGWGTIRDYVTVTNEQGGTDIGCRFIPDDGSAPIPLTWEDTTPVPEMGEYARGYISDSELMIKVSAETMADAEGVFGRINKMPPAKRALMYADDGKDYQTYGWAWTPDYKLVKGAPGLTR